MTAIANWYVDQVATYGWTVCIGVPASGFLTLWLGAWTLVHHAETRRARRRTPAAPDNQPGTDADLLWTCRRIDSQWPADPSANRLAAQYLRDQQRKEKP